MGTLAAGVTAAGDVNRDGLADIVVADSAAERVDVFRGATDWSFTANADLTIRLESSEPFRFFLTVGNQGPDTARLRVQDVLAPALPNLSWFCYWLTGSVMASCLVETANGNIDTLVTIAPGNELIYQIEFSPVVLPVTNTASLALPEWVVDPDLSNNQATVTVGPLEEAIFADGFESG